MQSAQAEKLVKDANSRDVHAQKRALEELQRETKVSALRRHWTFVLMLLCVRMSLLPTNSWKRTEFKY